MSIPEQQFPYLLAVGVSLDSPEVASQIANSLVEKFVEADLSLRARRARERTSFINLLIEDAGVDLRAAEDTLEKFKDSNRLLSSIPVATEKVRLQRDLEVQREFYVRLRKQSLFYELAGQKGISAISIVEKARPAIEPYTLRVRTKVGLAGAGSLLLAVILACAVESLRGRFQ